MPFQAIACPPYGGSPVLISRLYAFGHCPSEHSCPFSMLPPSFRLTDSVPLPKTRSIYGGRNFRPPHQNKTTRSRFPHNPDEYPIQKLPYTHDTAHQYSFFVPFGRSSGHMTLFTIHRKNALISTLLAQRFFPFSKCTARKRVRTLHPPLTGWSYYSCRNGFNTY